MTQKSISTLSMKRILISLSLFIAIPATAILINTFIRQYAISLMFTMNFFGSILIFYDWNLFGIHYNRAKDNIFDTVLCTFIAIVGMLLWVYVSSKYLHANVIIPGDTDLIAYGYARAGMLIAFSFMQSTVVSLSFKCLTDHLEVRGRLLQAILISGLSFGLFYTLLFMTTLDLNLFLRTYLYNFVLVSMLSFLYAKSNNLFSGMVAMGAVYLAVMMYIVM